MRLQSSVTYLHWDKEIPGHCPVLGDRGEGREQTGHRRATVYCAAHALARPVLGRRAPGLGASPAAPGPLRRGPHRAGCTDHRPRRALGPWKASGATARAAAWPEGPHPHPAPRPAPSSSRAAPPRPVPRDPPRPAPWAPPRPPGTSSHGVHIAPPSVASLTVWVLTSAGRWARAAPHGGSRERGPSASARPSVRGEMRRP